MKHLLSRTLLLASVLSLANCGGGGGGGGGEFVGAARVDLSASPNRIDTGDRTEVQIRISEVHKDGIALKIRYPKGLEYVSASSFIAQGNTDTDVDPMVNQTKESDVYLVYYISNETLGKNKEGILTFELEGKDNIEDGTIEVDPDVDDPQIDNATEFDIQHPEFEGEQEVSITVTQ